ncbi:MAG: phosphatidate cytidylyltransferase [Burkholderiales bacterium]|nr:phosphatidate cytidylyltransferase [Burkholderiales bacterium]
MLLHRVITSLILLLLTYLVFFQAPDRVFVVAITLFFAVGVYELLRMYKSLKYINIYITIIFIIISLLLNFTQYDISQVVRFVSVALWCFVAPFILIAQPKKFHLLIILLLAFLVFGLASYSLVILHDALGVWQLLSIMSVAWVGDIGAYFVGRKFGRHKLAPNISPGKSIEGALAGMALVIIYLSILKYFNLAIYLYSYVAVLKFGIILVIAGIIGDLFESWLKRVAGVKDSGTILPGHGGVFDRVDSLLAVLAIAFAMIRGLL